MDKYLMWGKGPIASLLPSLVCLRQKRGAKNSSERINYAVAFVKGDSVETVHEPLRTSAKLMLAVSRVQERAKSSNLRQTEQPRDMQVTDPRRPCRCGMRLLPP